MAEAIELAVVGAGPAGLAAAVESAGLGLSVTIVDAFPLPGGQYFKQAPPEFSAAPVPDGQARQLLGGLGQSGVRLLPETLVWGIFPEDKGYLLCLYGPTGTPRRLRTAKVILAPGAYERPVPFPGWTLPGVMTAGAALTMVKVQGVLLGRRVLLSGTGPLQWVLARHLIDAGAQLSGILDANRFPWRPWRHAAAVWGQWARLSEGWQAWETMVRAGARIRWGYSVFRAEGDGQVERAVIGAVDGSRSETVLADTICVGHGFTPAVQLSRLAGCEHRYQPDQAAYVPVRDEWLQTTLGGLFVAGDGAGIGGKDVALLEGQLAAMGAALQLGRDVPPARISSLKRELRRQRRFAAVLDALFPYQPLGNLLTDDTVVCRCEEVSVAEIRRAVAEGATTVSAVRMLTRAGMGRCQGRMCDSSVAGLLARELDQPAEGVAIPGWNRATPRPPILPVPLEGMLEEER